MLPSLALLALLALGMFAILSYNAVRRARAQRKQHEQAAQAWNNAPTPHAPRLKFSAFELRPRMWYRVVISFVDHDRVSHEVGERWRFLRQAFLPYEDGLSLFVEQDGREVHIRLQCREDEQGGIVNAFSDFVVEE